MCLKQAKVFPFSNFQQCHLRVFQNLACRLIDEGIAASVQAALSRSRMSSTASLAIPVALTCIFLATMYCLGNVLFHFGFSDDHCVPTRFWMMLTFK